MWAINLQNLVCLANGDNMHDTFDRDELSIVIIWDPFISAEPNTQPNEWIHLYINPGPNAVAIEAYAECAKLVDVS